MKRIIMLFFAIILILCSACGSSKTPTKADTLHNVRLGADVALGMKKAKIDKTFGESTASESFNAYLDSGLAVIYNEGKAALITVTSSSWRAIDGVYVGMGKDELIKTFGMLGTGGEDSVIYMFDKHSNVTFYDRESADVLMILGLEDGAINAISLAHN